MLNQALHWIDQGIAVIPIGYRSKRPARYHLNNGEWKQYQKTLPCRCVLSQWFTGGLVNMAIVCGWQNLCIIDFDNLAAHELWLMTHGANGYADTYTVQTGRGYHYYYFVEDFPSHTMKWAGGEVKASGYCLAPPSIHPTGTPYKAIAPDNEIMTIGSIHEFLPEELFAAAELPTVKSNVWDSGPKIEGCSYEEINYRNRILSFFPNARQTGNGWYTVICPGS